MPKVTHITLSNPESDKIRALFKDNYHLIHLIKEVKFIGANVNDAEALKFLEERIAFHKQFD